MCSFTWFKFLYVFNFWFLETVFCHQFDRVSGVLFGIKMEKSAHAFCLSEAPIAAQNVITCNINF